MHCTNKNFGRTKVRLATPRRMFEFLHINVGERRMLSHRWRLLIILVRSIGGIPNTAPQVTELAHSLIRVSRTIYIVVNTLGISLHYKQQTRDKRRKKLPSVSSNMYFTYNRNLEILPPRPRKMTKNTRNYIPNES